MQDNKAIVPPNFYKPSELMGIFKNFFSHKEINASVLCLQGIYFKSDKVYGNAAWDQLRDENTSESLTVIVPVSLRNDLQNGNLISVYGTLDRRVQNNGSIQFLLNVSRIDKVKDIAVSEDEVKRAECRRRKGELGYKNVDSILENKLFVNQRPKVALIYADTSITNSDFEKGLAAAKSSIDFVESRISFANSQALCTLLKSLDSQDYDLIAIIRGGGSGIEKLDDIAVVETLTNLTTAWIYGVGHEKENLFIRNIADKVIPIPFALGTYFRDTVENVIQKRNNSRAVLVQEVKKQYEKQIEDSNKKNQELTKQLESLQKQNKEQAETSQKQIAALTKAHEESQKQMKNQAEQFQKATEEAQKQAKSQSEAAEKVNKELQERLEKQGKVLADMTEQQKKQQGDFNKSLSQMQETNKGLQASVTKMTNELMTARQKISELESQKPSTTGYIVAIVILVILVLIGFMK
ncbi:exonuclease VII large subunit [Phocaeicola vulgatus]|jgi:exodeoxyribonuclease VII large subunit|uniref:exodeoxyribonuclease VII large subunit n=2 Tax=Phocaeicola vulgatus TaxID=821 RepID=UPI000E43CEBF|nr:exodeoxyribonuclease VII large subunit [Phocaeicola vulgatus]RGM79452.1 exonuclease VII large subunit [Phocaeicola vulgatus]RGN00609.1 exonuclease VII large subunit [Phocaeicola vulgatus]